MLSLFHSPSSTDSDDACTTAIELPIVTAVQSPITIRVVAPAVAYLCHSYPVTFEIANNTSTIQV